MIHDNSSSALEDGGNKGGQDFQGGASGTSGIDYLDLSRRAYKSSTDFMSSNLRRQWERNISNFFSRHPPGSKYRTDAYKHRSRLFRPKTRASVRSKEAALAIAFFSTSDVVAVKASDQSDHNAVASAKVMQEVVNMRLHKTIKWFPIVVAAFQEAMVMGTVISYQYWHYEEEKGKKNKRMVERYDDTIGNLVEEEEEYEEEPTILKDEPVIELIENENFRIDPGANWLDPINSSPYVIQLIPMYIVDVLDRMNQQDTKTGQPVWKTLTLAEISVAQTKGTEYYDSTRVTREGNRQDPKDNLTGDIDVYTIVWVHRNIFRIPGEGDYVWYTLGTQHMLTDPVPLADVYLHGRRPYALGHSVIEAHRSYPSGSVELGQDIQAATNENQNQRFDNIRQVLNKRYFVRRGSTVDLRSLRRNVSGSITMMGDVDKDVKVNEPGDVTRSSSDEQQLFNADFDEIQGGFSASNVQNSRQLSETVGGAKLLKEPSNALTEYMIRVFSETWVSEVMDQLVALEQAYETDEVLVTAAGKTAKVDKVPGNIMRAQLETSADVGFGVTDPQGRVGKIVYGVEAVSKLAPSAMTRLKDEEVVKEIWGILGYQDGSRFFMNDEEYAKYQEENPPQQSPEQLKIEAQKEIAAAQIRSNEMIKAVDIEQDRMIWAERILSDERQKAAELSVKVGETVSSNEMEELGKSADIEKVNIEKFKAVTAEKKVEYDHEDSLRKDAEIRDVEKPKTNRSGGGS